MTAVITRARSLRQEFRPMFSLAVPVVFAELGWMAMGIVDTLMVGRIGPEAIGAVGVGTSLFMGVVIVAMGVLLGLDTLVSHAFGAGRLLDCHRWLLHGCVLVGVVSLPLTWVLWLVAGWLDAWGLDPRVLEPTRSYLGAVTWSVVPLLLYTAFRRYLQGMGVVRPIMMALLTANVANVILNWMLIFGNLGAPALGVTGAAWATVGSRVVMAGFLLLVIAHRERGLQPGLLQTPLRVDLSWMRRLLVLGSPAALQITLEVGVFAAATALAGRLVPAALAAHQIALNVAAFAFMVPFGVSSAGAVRVGHAVGRVDPHAASRAGWTALLFGVGFMTLAALTFVTIPSLLISAFTTDARVLDIGVSLLLVAAVFQMFDGLQVVATGVLRGLGDTRTPMLWNLAGHWLIGLPLGYTLCFNVGFGVVGLWWGLSTGLIICGIALLAVWRQRIHALVAKDTTVDSRSR